MFMMFTMLKVDILPLGDLGIKKAIQKLFKLQNLPSDKLMIEKSLK